MPSVNRVTLIGHLGGDPELKQTKNGKAFVSFSMATSRQVKGSNGDKDEKTTWHRVVSYVPYAESLASELKKGGLVYVEGEIETRQYEKDGEKRTITEIVGLRVSNLAPRKAVSGDLEDAIPF